MQKKLAKSVARTNLLPLRRSPFVEKETENGKEVFDVTLPIHDSNGQRVGTVGMDFKPEPRQEQAKVIERAKQIAKELESRIITKERLFEPTSST